MSKIVPEPAIKKIEPSDKLTKSTGNETIFRLYKIDLLLIKSEPIEIRDRAFIVPDKDGKMAVSIGFVRSPTDRIYYRIGDNLGIFDEVYFLND